MLEAADVEGPWQERGQVAEDWLHGWTGQTDRAYRGRGEQRRVLLRPAEGRRWPVGAGKVGDHARGWRMAWRWLQDFGTAASTGRVEAEAKARRLLTRLGGCLPRLGVIWEERQLLIPGAHPDLLGAWVDEAGQEFRKVQAADPASRRAAWRTWAAGTVQSRPRRLYRWVRGEAQPPPTAMTVDGRWTLDPRAFVEEEARKWNELWSPEGPSLGPPGSRWVLP